MELYFDIGSMSLNKHGEELCGDCIEIIHSRNSVILVLADGLGSGVKASILSTLTTKIIGTMISLGSQIDEVVETVLNTLPVCSERGIAYSTFSILQIFNSGKAYLMEFDNPAILFFRKRKMIELQKEEILIGNKLVYETYFDVFPGDTFILVSDGVIHAGVGKTLNFGWQRENFEQYIRDNCLSGISSKSIAKLLISACDSLYKSIPGDDTTAAVLRIVPIQKTTVFVGPPLDQSMDREIVKRFSKEQGKRVVCGGTSAQIVARELKREIVTDLNYYSPDIPPMAKIKGIHLVTEGIVTLKKALEYLKAYSVGTNRKEDYLNLRGEDGASTLARILIEESTHIHFYIGRGVNPYGKNLDSSFSRTYIIPEVVDYLKCIGKQVTLEYN